MVSRKLFGLHRFLQEPGDCAIAASASVANYYNGEINYDFARNIVQPDGEGMYTPGIGHLLNDLGFTDVTIISADIQLLDFQWKELDQLHLLRELRKAKKKHSDRGIRKIAEEYVEFLSDPVCDNKVVIDRHFGKYVRKFVGQLGIPILASFNWNLFFEFPKWNDNNKVDPIRGNFEEHEVVIYGCDEKGVDILDSHHEMYEGRLAKYRTGRYRMDWETLMTVMGFGDLIIPTGYVEPRVNPNELVQTK